MDIVTLLESQFCHFLWEEYIMEFWIVSVPALHAGRKSRLRGTNGAGAACWGKRPTLFEDFHPPGTLSREGEHHAIP